MNKDQPIQYLYFHPSQHNNILPPALIFIIRNIRAGGNIFLIINILTLTPNDKGALADRKIAIKFQ